MDLRKRKVTLGASEERLKKLIESRILASNNEKEIIDQKIWDLFGENWCIMFTDLSGFSKKTAKFGIIHFLQTIYESEVILEPIIEKHDGFLLKTEGDSMLIIYRNPDKALSSAIEMQSSLKEYNKQKDEEDQVLLCLGLGYGKILRIGDDDVFGEEVNMASKLGEDTAKAYDILVTKNFKLNCSLDNINFEEKGTIFENSSNYYKVIY